jgi:hypothetical protein
MKSRLFLIALILIAIPRSNSAFAAQKRISRLAATVTELLDSQDVLDRAWGAYAVGEFGLAELLPRVKIILQTESNPLLIREALDAAIRLHAEVPDETLLKQYKGFPEESTILFAESVADHLDSMLSLFGSEADTVRWLALGNMALAARMPGFAAILMKELSQMHVFVSVSEQQIGIGCGGGCGRNGGMGIPAGSPPVATYMFTDRPSDNAVLAFPGPRPIYYERLVFVQGAETPNFPHIPCFMDRDLLRLEYLAALLGVPIESVQFENKPIRWIRWNGPDRYVSDVTQMCEEVLRQYETLAGRLAALRLLSDAECEALNPVINLQIDDVRMDKSVLLPEIKMSRVVLQ